MKELLRSPVIAALILAAALVYAAGEMSSPDIRIRGTTKVDGDVMPPNLQIFLHGQEAFPLHIRSH